MVSHSRLVPTASVLVAAFLAGSAAASRADAADVTLDAVVVEPATPAAATLCSLKVRLKNAGTQAVSDFAFSVTIDGVEVPTYKAHTYAINVDAGTTSEIALNNFWTAGTVKPFDVKVALTAAEWVQVKREGTTTTTTPAGSVAGLPASGSVTVKMSASK